MRKLMSQTREIKDYYEFIPHPDEDDGHWCLRLKEGKFKGVIYRYGKLAIDDKENNDGNLTAKFEYDIIKVPESIRDLNYSDEEGEEFITLIGDVLMEVLDKDLQETKEESEDGTTRKYNFEKSNI